jgi:hypothetical protein
MKKALLLLHLILLLFLLNSCSSVQKIELMKPEPDNATAVIFPVTSSYISFPVNLSIQDIEKQTNKTIVDVIYEDYNLEDDNTQMKIWKQAPILMTEDNSKLKSVIPLKIWVKIKYGTSALGMDLYDTKEFNLNGIITLLSDVRMTNWKINTQTQLIDFYWNESPSITIAGKQIAITYLINSTIKLFRNKIEKTIDESLNKTLDFKTNILELVQKASQPIQLSTTYQTWLKIVPQELYTTQSIIEKKAIRLNVGLKCLMESFIGTKPNTEFDKAKIILKSATTLPDKINANIAAVSTYQDASRIMTANFKGQTFGNEKRKVTVQNVEIWHKNSKMIIALDLIGSLNGKIYLSGFPQYNNQTKELYFDDLDYAIETKSKLIKTANWLAQSIILQKIRQSCRYSIEPNLEEGKKSILSYLTNYSPMQGIFVNGKLNSLTLEKIQLTNTAIVAFLNITGNAKISINGI